MEVAAGSQADGVVLLEESNGFPTDAPPGHAETNLARAAAGKYAPSFLRGYALYTSVEPCCTESIGPDTCLSR